MHEIDTVLSSARGGWSRANSVLIDAQATKQEKELAQALAEVSFAVVTLAEKYRKSVQR